jgi:hypothetical protein
MARTKLVFYGTDESKTSETELSCYLNYKNQIFIEIYDKENEYNSGFICLDKSTAIKLHRELKKQISYIQEDGKNE